MIEKFNSEGGKVKEIINVIGAGLAGVEAAYKVAEKGHKVKILR